MIKPRHLVVIFIPAIILIIWILYGFLSKNYQDAVKLKEIYDRDNSLDLIPILPGDPLIGNPRAATNIIVFEDFGCDGCAAQTALLDQLLEKYPDKFNIIWKGLPVTHFPDSSEEVHSYAYCANKQGRFSAFKDIAFANNKNLSTENLKIISDTIHLDPKELDDCLHSEFPKEKIKQVQDLAYTLNIASVPTIFIDNKEVLPQDSLEGWEAYFEL
ncbi:MAG: hypothetical protein COV59_04220 [Candidatus Magasanikbacteria bacterium CG11_big_fil_rev_8_21_14_0_20_39_34]|uniref:Thioredoxin-like fold domain-containing protein n=1 Tax=Candidatus Magasanikbacteria bacterium CG11_big_fil_rev_8_21_14_0_20_39_34 TaxID=1974653 RepID=A0A2H0N6V1_9BACT|nr:MAG: hypothetical protein COV59_04220 [Candidatus Magasanikbacteria bacterium CG11_big_fil_rev_8_21_14_0_20_39_34]